MSCLWVRFLFPPLPFHAPFPPPFLFLPSPTALAQERLTSAPDISMPIMSGIESTRHIRRFEKEHGLEPVALIALTGAANPNTRQEAFSSGVDLFLTKPVPMKALRGMLEDLRREGRAAFAG
jgi:CheY-like chemotaxis protein